MADFDYKLQHRQTQLEISWDGKTLKAQDRALSIEVPLTKCSEGFLKEFFSLETEYWKDRPVSEPDSILVKRKNEKLLVSSQSRLGGHLLSLGHKVRFLKTNIEMNCSVKKKVKP